MNKNPRAHEWYSEPAGSVTAGWGLTLSARDMAKIGTMLLNGGEYDGKQILSKGWITQMTSPKLRLGIEFGNLFYGYLWYKIRKNKDIYAAIGDGGNVIYVNAEKNITVGVTGTFKPRIFDRVIFIERNVLPIAEGE